MSRDRENRNMRGDFFPTQRVVDVWMVLPEEVEAGTIQHLKGIWSGK